MGGHRWWCRNYGWSWLVVGSGCKIMTGRGCSWMVVGGGDKIMAGRGWSCMVVGGRTS